MKQSYALSLYAILAGLCIAFDRFTKQWALAYADSVYDITSWLSIDVLYNRGISWGMLHGQDTWQFIIVSILIVGITIAVGMHAFFMFTQRRCIAGHVLVIAGSFSNIIDRICYGGVIDFVRLHYGDWAWPVFNIADVCIVAGAVLLIMLSVRDHD